MDIWPNTVSFRLVNTIDVRAETDIPTGYTGRVRVVAQGYVRSIGWLEQGSYHDPAASTPAYVRLRRDGRVKQARFYRRGKLHDPEPDTPAVRGFFANGARRYAEHYRDGRRCDSQNGAPAITTWRLDGSVRKEIRYTHLPRRAREWTLPEPELVAGPA
ncbi:MAG: hypothetical protein QNJ12_10180 [Ilumatobacter sp.]|uniref:hypothetical protein n=1 Tax=Ilumatobacter sp. TaxID=1967498 RepID=UPI002604F21E|nr:hypothetical protein [Ilumatobacter sp.]MDJ0769154.1 hypothetical protein [Ilumatobacter sp.]